jgi:hypothetical protein
MKSFGANIFCGVCAAQPFPDNPAIRESFNLTRIGDDWFCEQHRPSTKEKRASRAIAAAPAEAVDQFEQVLAGEFAGLEEAIANDDRGDAAGAFKDYGEALGRALTDLKKAIVEQTPGRVEKAVQNKRPREKPITARERDQEGQGDLIADPKTEGA